ncbi:MAG: hypothetical protein HY422_01900 [Candidatus Komeilibacteria bacterium]|nr:hypothetical protein [Candidatus Komeilibacteria bacterium]
MAQVGYERIDGRFGLCSFLEEKGLTPQNAFVLLVRSELYDVFYYEAEDEGKKNK